MSLPFESENFDSSRSESLFQHISTPEQVLSEMVGATRSGGWIMVLDTDWSTISVEPAEVETEQRLRRFMTEQFLRIGAARRHLCRLFEQQHLKDVQWV